MVPAFFFIAVYVIGIICAFFLMNKEDYPVWQKCMFSLVWPFLLIFYGIHWLYNK